MINRGDRDAGCIDAPSFSSAFQQLTFPSLPWLAGQSKDTWYFSILWLELVTADGKINYCPTLTIPPQPPHLLGPELNEKENSMKTKQPIFFFKFDRPSLSLSKSSFCLNAKLCKNPLHRLVKTSIKLTKLLESADAKQTSIKTNQVESRTLIGCSKASWRVISTCSLPTSPFITAVCFFIFCVSD